MNMKTMAAAAALSLGLVGAGAANAAITVSSTTPFTTSTTGKNVVLNFDAASAGATTVTSNGFSITGGQVFAVPGTQGTAVAPLGDNSANFYAVTAGQTATLTGATLPTQTGLSLFIGSLDNFNSIQFLGSGGFNQTFTGDILALAPNVTDSGSQTTTDANREFNFAFNGATITSVVFSSSQNAFEFDNIAVSSAPEPGIWALMIAGVGMMGAALRQSRRRRVGTTFA